MKVYLIKASAPGPFKDYKKATGGPPQNIFSVAAATPTGVDVTMCDETIGMKPKMRLDADIVVLFFHTPDAIHAYKLADKYRKSGKTVILGGLHITFMPDEAEKHADALLLGETEGIWEQLLEDYSKDQLKQRYQRKEPIDLAELKPYPTDIIPPSKYNHLWSVVVSRGCPHRCAYCTVPRFFNCQYRLRPVENIVEEIKTVPTDWFELHADNLTANRKYALELFNALKPLNINWFGEATIKMANDEELLKAAADSGCRELLIGIETPSQAALDESGKGFVSPEQVKEKIARFHEVGIQVSSSMIFGFDTHTNDIFRESEEFCRYIGIDEVEGVLLIPFPGTPLYKNLVANGRILTHDWSKYDGANVVFQPKGMSVKELNEGSYWFWKTLQKNKNIRTTSSSTTWASRTGNTATTKEKKTSITIGAPSASRFNIKWKALAGLALIGIGFYMNWYWVWGVLFLLWAIGDIRRQSTHLLEEVTREETPILYWVIITLWLACSLFAFSTIPVSAEIVKSVEVISQQQTETISSDTYGYSFKVPGIWSIDEESEEKDSQSYTLESKKKDASMYILAVDFQKPAMVEQLEAIFQKEFAEEPLFLDLTTSIAPHPPIIMKDPGTKIHFRQNGGKWQGHDVTALMGYAVKESRGYILLGIFGTKDKNQSAVVRNILESVTISR